MSRPTSSSLASAWEWSLVALLGANFVWTTLCLGGFLAETAAVTCLLTSALLAVYAFGGCFRRSGEGTGAAGSAANTALRLHPAGWLFVPFVLYAAANVLWVTPVRWLGWLDWFNWAQMAAVFWVVLNGIRSRAADRALLGVLLTLAVVAVLLGCYQRFIRPDWLMLGRVQATQYAGRASGCFGIPNSLAALLLLVMPFTGALALRRNAAATSRVFFGWLTLVFAFGLVLTISRGAWFGLAAALAAWPVLASHRPFARRLALGTAALAGMGALVAITVLASPRVRERFAELAANTGERSRPILWRAGARLFSEAPVLGTGGGSYNVLFERHRPEGFLHEPRWAHNEYLNTLSDYGAVGFILFFGAVGVVIVACARASRRERGRAASSEIGGPEGRGGAGFGPSSGRSSRELRPGRGDALDDPFVRQGLAIGLLAFALQLFVDFHFKLPALALAFATVAAVVIRRLWPSEIPRATTAPSRACRRAATFAAGLLALVFVVALYPQLRGEGVRVRARAAVDRLIDEDERTPAFGERLAGAAADLDRALHLAPGNAQAWSDRGYVRAQVARFEAADDLRQAGLRAEADANRALELSPVVAEFWIRRGVARDMQGRWTEAGADFLQAVSLSSKSVLPWYHYAYHLSLRPTGRDTADALAAFCLRLDPSDRRSQQLRQRLATGPSRP